MNNRQPPQGAVGMAPPPGLTVQPAMPSQAQPIGGPPQQLQPAPGSPVGMAPPQRMMPMNGPPVRQPPPAMAQQLARGLLNGRR